jgi:aspartyl-tRNA(Asn)/glutamyl-tRNA(Gln) amidotransferase subunit C
LRGRRFRQPTDRPWDGVAPGERRAALSVSREDVLHVAELARLDLPDEEVESLTADMNRILGFFERLSEVETEHVEAAFSALLGRDVFREDEVGQMLSNAEALANAPDRHEGYFRVPAFLPEE